MYINCGMVHKWNVQKFRRTEIKTHINIDKNHFNKNSTITNTTILGPAI